MALMRQAGFSPIGVAAPYGTWTPALADVIDGLGLLYSSEFSCAYDTLPLFPEVHGRVFRTLQVPIHPISIGSLRRAGATSQQMTEYYRSTIDAHWARDIPLIFYHHPTHRHWDVIEAILERGRSLNATPMRLGDWAQWWLGRTGLETGFDVRESVLRVSNAIALTKARVGIRVALTPEHALLLSPQETILLDSREGTSRPRAQVPDDLHRIRETDPRRLLGDLYTAILRRLK